VSVRGAMRDFQHRLYRNLLVRKLTPSPQSHGGVRGHHIKSNVEQHRGSTFVLKADISAFYPSIRYPRIYRLFVGRFRCSPDVARLCTQLCTYRYHLALGLITSPILADQTLQRVDHRIAAFCERADLIYTRYVDDITISGRYDLRKQRIANTVRQILRQDGFKVNAAKSETGRLSRGLTVTGLRVVRGRVDVRRAFLDELERQLHDAASLAQGGPFAGPYYLHDQVLGRVQFACWVNPSRKRSLCKKVRSIDWGAVEKEAQIRGYTVCRRTLRRMRRAAESLSSRSNPA
jgi:hypothetical protein